MRQEMRRNVEEFTRAMRQAVRKNPNAAINVDELKEYVNSNIVLHTELAKSINDLPKQLRMMWIKDRLVSQLREDHSGIADAYNTYVSTLKDRAASDERQNPLESLAKLNSTYVTTLRDIADFLNNETDPGQKITPENVRMNMVVVTTTIGSSNMIIRFTTLLLSCLIHLTIGDKVDIAIPRYRIDFLLDNAKQVAEVNNESYAHRNKVDVVEEIRTMRRRDGDVRLLDSSFYSPGGVFDSILTIIGSVVSFVTKYAIPVFSILMSGNAVSNWNRSKMERYEHDKETLEWIQRHVSLLRLELDGTNPDDPRYSQLLKIIAAYDERITEYDRSIEKYERDVNNA